MMARPDATATANPYNRPQGQPIGPFGNLVQNIMQGVGEGTMLPTGNWGEPQNIMPMAQTLALLAATIAEPGPDIGPLAGKVLGKVGRLLKPAEHIAQENYLVPLSELTDAVYRETSLAGLEDMLPVGGSFTDYQFKDVFMANDPALALGQGTNKGVMLEFDPAQLRGKVNHSKPAWDQAYRNGSAEFIAKQNPQTAYQAALKSITISPNAQADRMIQRRMQNVLPRLEQAGWAKQVLEDGSVVFKRGDIK